MKTSMLRDQRKWWSLATRALAAITIGMAVASAAPHNGERYTYLQPDGQKVTVRLWGDEYFSYQETEDGYLVTRDPQSGEICYARVIKNGTVIVSTGVRVDQHAPPAGLKPGQRLTREARKEWAQRRRDAAGVGENGQLQPEARAKLFPGKKGGGKGKGTNQGKDPNSPTGSNQDTSQPAPAADGSVQYAPMDGEGSLVTAEVDSQTGIVTLAAGDPPTIMKRVGLVLLASFPDQAQDITKTQAEIDAFCNDPNYTGDGNATSVRGYFQIQSNGRVDYSNVVTAWFVAKNNRDYYADNTLDASVRGKELIKEGLDFLSANGFDFTQCDADGNGVLDTVNLIYAGASTSDWSKGLWRHKANYTYAGLTSQGLSSAFIYQLTDMPTSLPIGDFCHENGHMLFNFPDLYPYDDSAAKMGTYSLMSRYSPTHPQNIDPYLKINAGWAQVVDLDSSSSQVCLVQEDLNHFYRYTNPSRSDEHFLFEVRHNSGYEGPWGGHTTSVNPTSGLAVYHARGSNSSNIYSSIFTSDNPNFDFSKPYYLMLVEANPSTATTPWYGRPDPKSDDGFKSGGVDTLSDATMPALKFWATNGRTTPSGAVIRDISSAGSTMTFIAGSGAVTAPATMVATSGGIAASTSEGIDAASQNFALFNSGTGSFTYTVASSEPWLSLSPTSGAVSTAADVLTVTFTNAASSLTQGTYTADITISSTDASNASLVVPVTLEVDAAWTSPTITVQPTGTHLLGNQSYTLTAAATGYPTPNFEWYLDGVVIPGVYGSSLTITSASTANAGSYTVQAYNTAGAVTSNPAGVTVNDHPYITKVTPVKDYTVIPASNGLVLETSVIDDGYGGSSLTHAWTVESAPTGATVTWDQTDSPVTAAKFDLTGDYQLRLTSSDGLNSSSVDYYVSVGATPAWTTDPDLIVHYDFANTTGNTVADAAGGDQDGTLVGGTSFAGGALVVDGTGGHLAIPSDASIDTSGPYAKRTVMFWAKPYDPTSNAQILYEEGDAEAGMFIMATAGGSMVFRIWNQNGDIGNWGDFSPYMGPIWAPNQWNHVAVVLDADPNATTLQNGAFRIYLNGSLLRANKGVRLDSHPGGIALGGINGKIRSMASVVLIEGDPDYDFAGEFRDFRLYNRALTPSELLSAIELSNLGPQVDAGPPVTGFAGLPVALNGTVVDDELPKPTTLTTAWSLVSGPGTGSFADPAAIDTGFTANAEGSYVLRLAANDGQVTTFDQTTYDATVTTGPGFVVFTAGSQTLTEDAGTVEIPVSRPIGGGIDGAVSVDYAAVDGFAVNGNDYTLTPGTLHWADQESGPKTISVTITNDALMESNETFSIVLSNPTGGLVVTSPSIHQVTIETSDFPTAWFIWDAALDEPGDDLWPSATANEYTWDFDGLNRSPDDASGSRLQALTKAYPFPEIADFNNTGWDSFGSNGPATFEFVIDVDGDNGIIFETGGSTDGIRLDLINGTLRGMIAESTDVTVSHPLTADEKFDFIHVMLVADNAANVLQLYVNGVLKDSQAWTAGNDWSNTENAGLGGAYGNTTPDGTDSGSFDGAMAVFRFYRSAFSPAQALAAYESFHPLSNEAPVFTSNPVDGGTLVEGAAHTGTLAGSATDADGNPITYAKVSGPEWLVVATNGALSGTPGATDVGTNSFVVSAGDGISAPVEATLLITVQPQFPTLTYAGNGSTGGTTPVDPSSPYPNGANVTVLGHGDLARANHSFDSWNTAADGSGDSYAANDTLVLTSHTTLYAQWTGDVYTVTFDASGGTATSPLSIDVTYLSTYGTLPITSRDGYSFVGWFTASSGGSEVTAATTVTATSNHTLYAQWNALPSVSAGDTQSVAIGPFVPWTPTEASGIVAWYDADDAGTVTLANGKVSQWDDKSGNNRHATQATTASQPNYLASDPMVNNQPSIGNIAASGSIGLITPTMATKNVYVVTYYKDGADSSFDGYSTLMSGGATYGEYRVMGNQNSSSFIATSNYNNAGTFKNGATSSSTSVLPMAASVLKLKSSAARSQGYRLGFNGDADTRDWQGAYSEWVFTDGTEDAAAEQMIEGYLAHKWELAGSLASGHPYAAKAPGTEEVTVNLTPTLSDTEDDSLTVLWSLVSGPGTVVFGDPTVANTTATFGALGDYVLRLTVNDGFGEISNEVTITVDTNGDDITPPTLASSSIVDDQGGADVAPNDTVIYTITFSEDMDETTVDAADFSNAGTAPVTIGTITETSPGVFTVEVTPTGIGSLQLQVSATAELADPTGNALDTTNAIADDTVIAVITMLTVPDVVGLAQATAESNLVTVGFTVGTITSQADPLVPAGQVISQNPSAGTSAVSGSAVDLVVSLGPELLVTTNDGSGGVSGHLDWDDGGVFGTTSWHVKNPNKLDGYTRKGYVRFDTNSLGNALTSAALELTVMNIDASIGDNDQSLYIYGISDESLDAVPLDGTLTWATGPGNNVSSPYLADTSKATLLGILLLDYNGDKAAPIGTTVSFSSQALLDFLNADTNQKATFLIGRTGNKSEQNLMFAGDTNTTYAAPGLRVTRTVTQTPTITSWPTAATITEGQALSAATLSGGSASVAGTFTYDTPAAVPAVGTSSVAVTFTPTDTANYTSVSGTVEVTVLTAFDAWVATAESGSGATFTGDSNNDGMPDGLGWLLGAPSPDQKATALIPLATENDGSLALSFTMLNASKRGSAALNLQYSKDLGISDPWTNHTLTIPDLSSTISGVDFVITPIGETDLNQVQVTVPSSAADSGNKIFVRLIGDLPAP